MDAWPSRVRISVSDHARPHHPDMSDAAHVWRRSCHRTGRPSSASRSQVAEVLGDTPRNRVGGFPRRCAPRIDGKSNNPSGLRPFGRPLLRVYVGSVASHRFAASSASPNSGTLRGFPLVVGTVCDPPCRIRMWGSSPSTTTSRNRLPTARASVRPSRSRRSTVQASDCGEDALLLVHGEVVHASIPQVTPRAGEPIEPCRQGVRPPRPLRASRGRERRQDERASLPRAPRPRRSPRDRDPSRSRTQRASRVCVERDASVRLFLGRDLHVPDHLRPRRNDGWMGERCYCQPIPTACVRQCQPPARNR